MSDYIKREDAIGMAAELVGYFLGDKYDKLSDIYHLQSVTDTILHKMKSIPSADVVEVVRCKDCKHRKVQGEGMTHWYGCLWRGSCNDNDFCSYGERVES